MKAPSVTLALVAGAALLLPGTAMAQQVDIGESEFASHCAACHGFSGTGMGPYAEFVVMEAPDLTRLSAESGGVFPADHIREVIDGRREVALHGPRDMPIWGLEFNDEAVAYYREVWKIEDAEAMVRKRVDALVAHIESLQKP